MSHVIKIAHRGYSEKYPENTMEAFEAAIAAGAHMIELDVHLSSDKRVVVIHDDYIDRTSSGSGMVKDLSFSGLRSFSYHNTFDNYDSVQIPLLDEVLDLCRGKCEVNIELKNLPVLYNGLEDGVLDIINRCSAMDYVIISSFDHYALKKTKTLVPEVRIGMLYDALWMYFKEEVEKLDLYSVHPNVDVIYPDHLMWCQRKDILVLPWVAKSKRDMDRMMSHEFVSGIMVNELTLFDGYSNV
jgi:glycerophosphoryl diester phosphodiesterase